LQIFEVVM